MKADYEFFEKEYKRIWENFRFSFYMYQANIIYQRRLCVDILEQIKILYKKFLENYQVATTGLYQKYIILVEDTYKRIK